jgi:hypothetical protein
MPQKSFLMSQIVFGLNLKPRRGRLAFEDFITLTSEKMIVGAGNGDPTREGSCGSQPDPRLAAPWVTARPIANSAVGLLSFSQTISLSLLNDKKEKEECERLSAGRKKWNEEEEIRENLVFYDVR